MWDTTTPNWNAGTVAWPASGDNDAVFAGPAGTVTIAADGVTATDLQFSTTGYVVAGGTLTLATAQPVFTVDSGLNATITSLIDASTVASGFRKRGAGTLTLEAGAILRASPGSNNESYITGGSVLLTGGTLGGTASPRLYVGSSGGGTGPGALRQSGGLADFGTTSGQFLVGHGSNYGFYELAGGTFKQTATSSLTSRAGVRAGAMYMTGGNLEFTSSGQHFEAGGSGNGVVYATGGTATLTAPSASTLALSIATTQTGQVTVGGTADWSNSGRTDFSTGATLNLNNSGRFSAATLSPTGVGRGRLNFDGGTLRAVVSSATYLQDLAGVQINAGGATIDTNGQDITIAQPLLGPTGAGVTGIALDSPGSGYLGPPVVTLSGGGGTGATAVADWNPSTGAITGFTITNPGSGYTSAPTVTLSGGTQAGSTAAVLGSVTVGSVVGGGLTKTGSGVLTLSGSNTFPGLTTVAAGTLALAATGSINHAAGVSIAAGAAFDVTALAGGGFTLGGGKSIGGKGALLGDLVFGAGSKFSFLAGELSQLSVSGTTSFAASFGVADVLNLDASTAVGTYTLIDGTVDFTNLLNASPATAYPLGGGKSAYFQEGSLQLVVVPEPGGLGLGMAAVVAWLAAGRLRRVRS